MVMTRMVIESAKAARVNHLTREVGTIRQQASHESSRPNPAVVTQTT